MDTSAPNFPIVSNTRNPEVIARKTPASWAEASGATTETSPKFVPAETAAPTRFATLPGHRRKFCVRTGWRAS